MQKDLKQDILIGQFDAKIWAEEFVKMVKKNPKIANDMGTMIAWFANAIMAGYDRAKQQDATAKSRQYHTE